MLEGRAKLGESEIENVLRKEGFKYVCAVSAMVLVTEYVWWNVKWQSEFEFGYEAKERSDIQGAT